MDGKLRTDPVIRWRPRRPGWLQFSRLEVWETEGGRSRALAALAHEQFRNGAELEPAGIPGSLGRIAGVAVKGSRGFGASAGPGAERPASPAESADVVASRGSGPPPSCEGGHAGVASATSARGPGKLSQRQLGPQAGTHHSADRSDAGLSSLCGIVDKPHLALPARGHPVCAQPAGVYACRTQAGRQLAALSLRSPRGLEAAP